MDAVAVKELTKVYRQGGEEVRVLDRAELRVRQGELVAVTGRSGSGKSTLLNLIGGLERPTAGTVEIDGVDIHTGGDGQRARLRRRKIGYIFQDFQLLPILSAEENIIMPLLLDSRAVDRGYLAELAALLGLEGRLSHLPGQLSGGQKQRVAIARALINRPSILLADEPTGNLDRKTADEIMALLLEVHRRGNTILLVTHDERYARLCQRQITIRDGAIL